MKKLRRKLYRMLPAKLKFTFSSIWENHKRGRPYYSQNGEDIVLQKFFGSKSKGFYVDVGAHHPKKYSNTHLLHKQGWSGINIDANPKSIAAFKKLRPNDTNLNIGIGEKPGVLTFHEFADPAVNTFSESQANEWIENRKWNKYLGPREVEVENINNVLTKHLPENQTIDLLTVDVESMDEKIIKSLDFATYKPRAIVIEDHNFDDKKPENSQIYNFLVGRGYTLHCNLSFSLIFKLMR